jgi:hypothetical protein
MLRFECIRAGGTKCLHLAAVNQRTGVEEACHLLGTVDFAMHEYETKDSTL